MQLIFFGILQFVPRVTNCVTVGNTRWHVKSCCCCWRADLHVINFTKWPAGFLCNTFFCLEQPWTHSNHSHSFYFQSSLWSPQEKSMLSVWGVKRDKLRLEKAAHSHSFRIWDLLRLGHRGENMRGNDSMCLACAPGLCLLPWPSPLTEPSPTDWVHSRDVHIRKFALKVTSFFDWSATEPFIFSMRSHIHQHVSQLQFNLLERKLFLPHL